MDRLVTWIMIALILLSFTLTIDTYGNPIPYPTVILKNERISINITQGPGSDSLTINVYGFFRFRNVGYEKLEMYFPVPLEVREGNVTILLNGKPLDWEIVEEMTVPWSAGNLSQKYETVLGNLPLLKWSIDLSSTPSEAFNISVNYEYIIKPQLVEIGGKPVLIHRTIYAMATGRFYYQYSKTVNASLTIRFNGGKFNYARGNVSLVPSPVVVNQLVTRLILDDVMRDGYVLRIDERSPMFSGMLRDVIIDMVVLSQCLPKHRLLNHRQPPQPLHIPLRVKGKE